MKRSLATLMLIAVLSSCDEAAHDPDLMEARDPEPDAALVEPKISNAGEACSLLSRTCQGSHGQCLEISFSGVFYPGGYCTADCKTTAECGPTAECPVGEATLLNPTYRFRSTWARKCFKSCRPGVVDDCRAGYACLSLAEAYEAADAPPPMHKTVCLPRPPASSSMDGGSSRPREVDAGR